MIDPYSSNTALIDDEILSASLLYSEEEIYREFWERCYEAADLHLRAAAKAMVRMLERNSR